MSHAEYIFLIGLISEYWCPCKRSECSLNSSRADKVGYQAFSSDKESDCLKWRCCRKTAPADLVGQLNNEATGLLIFQVQAELLLIFLISSSGEILNTHLPTVFPQGAGCHSHFWLLFAFLHHFIFNLSSVHLMCCVNNCSSRSIPLCLSAIPTNHTHNLSPWRVMYSQHGGPDANLFCSSTFCSNCRLAFTETNPKVSLGCSAFCYAVHKLVLREIIYLHCENTVRLAHWFCLWENLSFIVSVFERETVSVHHFSSVFS